MGNCSAEASSRSTLVTHARARLTTTPAQPMNPENKFLDSI
jgi:hypothetical protein